MGVGSRAQDDGTFVVKTDDQKVVTRFTLDRDAARSQTGLDLLGLDLPIVQDAIKRWQAASPENIGVAVSGTGGPRSAQSVARRDARPRRRAPRQRVHAQGERRQASVTCASNVSEIRLVHARNPSQRDHAGGAQNAPLHEKIEPMLERENATQGVRSRGWQLLREADRLGRGVGGELTDPGREQAGRQ